MITEITIRPGETLAHIAVRAFIASMIAGLLIAFTYGYASAVAGLENGTIDTIYDVPKDGAGAYIGYPSAVACDSENNLYIALNGKYSRSAIMKMDARTGVVTRYAGSFDAAQAGSGDGGPASDAHISYVLGLAFDSNDNLYISDHGNHRVRLVAAEYPHIITTYAGNGSGGASSGDDGPATEATLRYVYSVSIDDGDNLYIGDYGRIRRVDYATKTITTVAGSSTTSSSRTGMPSGVTPTNVELSSQLEGMGFDSAGNLFFGSSNQWIVRHIDGDLSTIDTFAGGGASDWGDIPENVPATEAFMKYPDSIAVDEDDNVYIGARWMNCIRMVDQETGEIHTIAGKPGTTMGFSGDGGPAKYAELAMPYDMCLDGNGNMYIADTINYKIRKISNACALPVVDLTDAYVSGDNGVMLEWTADASTGCKEVESYVVYRDGSELAVLDGGTSSYADEVPEECREYCYSVTAVAGDESSASNEKCVILPDSTPPDSPANVIATALSGSEVLLTWDEAPDICDGTAAGYAVNMPDGTTIETADTSLSVTGLSRCSEYCFSVSAYDSSGNYSGASDTVCAKTFMVIECDSDSKNGGRKHNKGSAIPVRLTLKVGRAYIGPAEVGALAVRLFKVEDGGGMTEVPHKATGSKNGNFRYMGKGSWMVTLKTTSLEPGEYVLTAEPVFDNNSDCPYILLDPAPCFNFTVVGKKAKNTAAQKTKKKKR